MTNANLNGLIIPQGVSMAPPSIFGFSIFTVFLAFFVLAIVSIVVIFLVLRNWNKKFKSGDFESKLLAKINNRINIKGAPVVDYFQDVESIQTMPWNLRNIKYTSSFNDLFVKSDPSPIAITELRYTASLPLIYFLNGIFITVTKNHTVKTIIKKGIFQVYLDNVYIGYVNLSKRLIYNARNEKIGRVDAPSLYAVGINKVLWDIYFNKIKTCSIVASLTMVKSILSNSSPNYQYDIAEFYQTMTVEQKALILSIIFYIKIKQALKR